MKRLISSTLLLLASSSAFAVALGGGGCGWGNALFEGQAGPAPHILAVTTNGTSGNNTFGMTTGTNGCSTSGAIGYSGKSMLASVMDEFSEDAAKGEGEAMTAVSVAMGVSPEDRAHFAQLTHSNFSTIFPNQNVTADQVYTSLQQMMKTDTQLSKYAI